MYKLRTNQGEFIVRQHPTTDEKLQYFVKMFDRGMPLNEIQFEIISLELTARQVCQVLSEV